MRVLLTRPKEESEALASVLAARGIETVIEPLLTIRPKPEAAGPLRAVLQEAQAVLFTSANGVHCFAGLSSSRDIIALAVGDATAAAARKEGFSQVKSARGDVEDLARLALAELDQENGHVVHGAGSTVAGDLAGQLRLEGFEVRILALYDAEPSERLSEATLAAMAREEIDAALFFSPRTAESFVTLAKSAGVEEACAAIDAVALSEAVAKALSPLRWRGVRVAQAPNQDDLLVALASAK